MRCPTPTLMAEWNEVWQRMVTPMVGCRRHGEQIGFSLPSVLERLAVWRPVVSVNRADRRLRSDPALGTCLAV